MDIFGSSNLVLKLIGCDIEKSDMRDLVKLEPMHFLAFFKPIRDTILASQDGFSQSSAFLFAYRFDSRLVLSLEMSHSFLVCHAEGPTLQERSRYSLVRSLDKFSGKKLHFN
jgi:hypothetical protein